MPTNELKLTPEERFREVATILAAGLLRLSLEGGVRSPEEEGRTRRAPPDYGLKTPVSWDDRLPMPGTIVTREYKGQVFEVRVLPKGFEYQGEIFRTLSAVAKAITGMHWNGYHFFGLGVKTGRGKPEAPKKEATDAA